MYTEPKIDNINYEPQVNPETISEQVKAATKNYLSALNGKPASDLYQLVWKEVEQGLISEVLKFTNGNKTKAARLLGLNRTTLRAKIQEHRMD
mgnify:CR=1 FL=1